MTRPIRALLALLTAAALWAAPAAAQLVPGLGEAEAEAPAPDPLGRDTPRGAVDGLLAAFASGDAGAVLPFLDLSDLPPARRNIEGRRLAERLEATLDRGGRILPGFRLSTAPEGADGDGLAPDREAFAELIGDDGVVALTLARGPGEAAEDGADGPPVWRVSPEALATVAGLADVARLAPYERALPEALRDWTLWGAPVGAWIAAIVLGAVAVALAGLLVAGLVRLGGRVARPLRDGAPGRLLRAVRAPLALVLAAPVALGLSVAAGVPVVVRAALAPIVETAVWLALTWMVLRLVHAVGEELLESMTRRARLGAVSVVVLVRRFVVVVIVVIALALIAASFGLNLVGWFAALGIGGIAIALGAQKTIEHLVGGVSIVADQPIRVGDFCSVDGLMGTVEDIGLRSTRLRTLDRTLVTIPNGDLSSARIENYTSRDRFLWHATLGLRYETGAAQLRRIVRAIEVLLLSDDRVAEAPRVRFVAFGASSLDVEVFAYLLAPDYPESLATREELLLAVMEIVEAEGSGFAFPSQTVYLARDKAPAATGDEGDGTASPVRTGDL